MPVLEIHAVQPGRADQLVAALDHDAERHVVLALRRLGDEFLLIMQAHGAVHIKRAPYIRIIDPDHERRRVFLFQGTKIDLCSDQEWIFHDFSPLARLCPRKGVWNFRALKTSAFIEWRVPDTFSWAKPCAAQTRAGKPRFSKSIRADGWSANRLNERAYCMYPVD